MTAATHCPVTITSAARKFYATFRPLHIDLTPTIYPPNHSPQNGHCVEDSDCCQGNLSNANKRSVCRGTGSKVPGQSAKCGRAKPGDTVNLANMTFAIKNAVYQDPTKVSQSDLQSLKDALASRDDNPDDM